MKTKLTLFIVIIFMLSALNIYEASAQWVQQVSGTSYDLESVFFTDINTGYCTGFNPDTYMGTVYKTTNGGNTWDSLGINPGAPYPIYFTDANTGYLGCYDMILKTTDAGMNWTYYQLGLAVVIFSLDFPDANTGYLASNNFVQGMVYVLKTTDAGTSWTDVSPTVGNGDLRCVHCTDANTCYIGFSGDDITSAMMKTTDGGTTWTDISSPTSGEVWSIFFIDANTGFATGQGNGGECHIIKTVDAGTTWTEVLSTTEYPTGICICFPGPSLGYVVTGEGYILKSMDGGITWNSENSGVTTDLNAISFPSTEIGYVVGDGGVILKYDGSTGIEIPSNPQNNIVALYPNPIQTNATLSICEGINLNRAVLRILNIHGVEVMKISNIRSNKVQLHREGLSSGLYFYNLSDQRGSIYSGKIMID